MLNESSTPVIEHEPTVLVHSTTETKPMPMTWTWHALWPLAHALLYPFGTAGLRLDADQGDLVRTEHTDGIAPKTGTASEPQQPRHRQDGLRRNGYPSFASISQGDRSTAKTAHLAPVRQQAKKIQPPQSSWILEFWSGRSDSNTRPLAPHASALPGCATPRRCPVFGNGRYYTLNGRIYKGSFARW